jgi:hypothetical protein
MSERGRQHKMNHVLILLVWRMDKFLSLGGRSRHTARGVRCWTEQMFDDNSVFPFINHRLSFMSCSVHSTQLQINIGSDLVLDVNLTGDVNMAAENAAQTSLDA